MYLLHFRMLYKQLQDDTKYGHINFSANCLEGKSTLFDAHLNFQLYTEYTVKDVCFPVQAQYLHRVRMPYYCYITVPHIYTGKKVCAVKL
jgi:hypothetical protein